MANYHNQGLGALIGGTPTINITGAQGSASSTPWAAQGISSISLSDLDWNEPHVKKYQVLEIEEDLLALSCAWQRLRKAAVQDPSKYVSIEKLTAPSLFKKVENEDHEKAALVRDYFSKKIMLWKLKGDKLSKFREDMNTFIHTDGKIFKEDMQPLVYRLPEFYDYDVEFDKLTAEYNKKVDQEPRTQMSSRTIKLVKTFVVGKRYSKRKEYWFADEHKNLVTMCFTHDNPLIPLLDIYSKNPFKISANFTKKYRDNNEYLEANKFKFM